MCALISGYNVTTDVQAPRLLRWDLLDEAGIGIGAASSRELAALRGATLPIDIGKVLTCKRGLLASAASRGVLIRIEIEAVLPRSWLRPRTRCRLKVD